MSFDDFRSSSGTVGEISERQISNEDGKRPIPQPRRHLEKPIIEENEATGILRRITTIKDSEPPELLKFLETNISSAYSYETHVCVERSNQQILNILSKKLETDENWIDDIEEIIHQYYRTVQK